MSDWSMGLDHTSPRTSHFSKQYRFKQLSLLTRCDLRIATNRSRPRSIFDHPDDNLPRRLHLFHSPPHSHLQSLPDSAMHARISHSASLANAHLVSSYERQHDRDQLQ